MDELGAAYSRSQGARTPLQEIEQQQVKMWRLTGRGGVSQPLARASHEVFPLSRIQAGVPQGRLRLSLIEAAIAK
jgi:hypothetical protein